MIKSLILGSILVFSAAAAQADTTVQTFDPATGVVITTSNGDVAIREPRELDYQFKLAVIDKVEESATNERSFEKDTRGIFQRIFGIKKCKNRKSCGI